MVKKTAKSKTAKASTRTNAKTKLNNNAKAATTTKIPAAESVAASKAAVTPITTLASPASDRLRRWNIWLGIIFVVQAIVILVLSVSRILPITIQFLGNDTLATQAAGHTVTAAGTHHFFDLSLTWIVVIFLLVAALGHGLAATFWRKSYERDFARGVSTIRWVEYGLSGGLMLIAVGLVAGMRDFSSLLMIFAFGMIVGLAGLAVDMWRREAPDKTNVLSRTIVVVSGVIAGVVLLVYLLGAFAYGATLPGYVDWIYGTMFVLAIACLINWHKQHFKTGKWADNAYGERMFMILSLVAKTALAWQIFAGTLHP